MSEIPHDSVDFGYMALFCLQLYNQRTLCVLISTYMCARSLQCQCYITRLTDKAMPIRCSDVSLLNIFSTKNAPSSKNKLKQRCEMTANPAYCDLKYF